MGKRLEKRACHAHPECEGCRRTYIREDGKIWCPKSMDRKGTHRNGDYEFYYERNGNQHTDQMNN